MKTFAMGRIASTHAERVWPGIEPGTSRKKDSGFKVENLPKRESYH